MKLAHLWAALVLISAGAATAQAQVDPGEWSLGLRAGGAYATGSQVVRDRGQQGFVAGVRATPKQRRPQPAATGQRRALLR